MQFFASAFLLEFLAGVLLFIHIERFKSDLWIVFCAVIFLVMMGSGFDSIPTGEQRVFQYGPAALTLVSA